jgi:hypothetical protein
MPTNPRKRRWHPEKENFCKDVMYNPCTVRLRTKMLLAAESAKGTNTMIVKPCNE